MKFRRDGSNKSTEKKCLKKYVPLDTLFDNKIPDPSWYLTCILTCLLFDEPDMTVDTVTLLALIWTFATDTFSIKILYLFTTRKNF